ncbi:MAG: toll/interleukin-1 receptor domain-containing protein [Cyanobacteria bacterium P01_H01_bin.21]
MYPFLFLSYSRREVPFVNGLQNHLEKSGYEVWLDYHDLVPGKPWLEQILHGISKTDIFLLVISRASMGSENVDYEWKQALALNKRIILIIFEAIELPEELKACEWIDFRGSFKKAATQLITQIASPQVQKNVPPEKGFKAPKIVWITFAISIVISICSIFAFWTLYIPYYLVPLPYKLLKREFSFSNVQASTLMLPFALFWSVALFLPLEDVGHGWVTSSIFFALLASVVAAPALLIAIRLDGVQRWGKPIASRPRFSRLARGKIQKLKQQKFAPVNFTIDAAPEDKRYSRAIIRRLEKHGHTYVPCKPSAEYGIVLLSAFKTESCLDPEKQVVYPIIIQKSEVTDLRLKRIQWIDFRRGIKNMRSFCLLFSQPEKMVKALGIVPPGRQIVTPRIIQWVSYYLVLMAILQFGSILILLPQSLLVTIPKIKILIVSALVFIVLSTLVYRSLVNRRGQFNSIARLWLSILFLGGLLFNQAGIVSAEHNHFTDSSVALDFMSGLSWNMTSGIYLAIFVVYLLGLPLTFLGTVLSWHDLRRWLYR